jgi:hypothetical protein
MQLIDHLLGSQNSGKRDMRDVSVDSAFAIIFLACFCLTGFYSHKAFKFNPQMVNLPNILVVTFIQLTLFSKFYMTHFINSTVPKSDLLDFL